MYFFYAKFEYLPVIQIVTDNSDCYSFLGYRTETIYGNSSVELAVENGTIGSPPAPSAHYIVPLKELHHICCNTLYFCHR